MSEDLRYPIGRWQRPENPSAKDVSGWIDEIEIAPASLRAAVSGIGDSDLEMRYRPGGWTIRQVIHHVADSHLNSYVRFRLAMTEDQPTIRPYDEQAWAELPDARLGPIGVSLDLLDALHTRWVQLARTFSAEDLGRRFVHPEIDAAMRLDEALSSYAWHGRHHCAHVALARS